MEVEVPYLDLTILSAEDLKRSWLSGDQIVAVAWVDPTTKKTTQTASANGSNVAWPHENLMLNLNDSHTLQGKLLTIEIHARGMWGNSVLGSVYVPLVALPLNGDKEGSNILMYQIIQPSGKPQGSIKFFAKVVKSRVTDSPVGASGSAIPSPYTPSPYTPPRISPHEGSVSHAFYPSSTATCCVEASGRTSPSTTCLPCSPASDVSTYPPPQQHLFQDHMAGHDVWRPQHSHGTVSHPSHSAYPPTNAAYPPHIPPPVYPPQYPPLSVQFSEPYHTPPSSVYPPPKETSYLPIPLYPPYPPPAPQPPSAFQPASFYPNSNLSGTLYPPPYPPQEAGIHYPHHPLHCGMSY